MRHHIADPSFTASTGASRTTINSGWSAASSASGARPTARPRPSSRWACTPCSIAARKPAASPAFDGHRFHTERHMGHRRRRLRRRRPGQPPARPRRHRPHPLFHRRRQLHAQHPADVRRPGPGGIAIAHNGNLTNFLTLREQLVSEGAIFQSTSDSEVILHLIARSPQGQDRSTASSTPCRQIEGGYALVALTNKKLIGVRDPLGIRPLVLGELGDGLRCWRPRPAPST